MENNLKNIVCVYVQLNHLAVHLKHCKLTIFMGRNLCDLELGAVLRDNTKSTSYKRD